MGRQMFIQTRLVPDPSMTDAEFLFQKARELDRANAARSKPNLNLGKVRADENAMTRIGALVFIRKREDYHERAAEEFKSLYEARYGGQGGVMDPGRVQVDTSPIAHDSGMAAKIDRTVKLEMAIKAMDKHSLNRLVACLILGVSCEDQSDTLPSGRANQRQSGKCVEETLAALDHLATMWGYRTRAA